MLVIGNSKFHLLFWEEDGVTVDVGWEKEEEFGIDGDIPVFNCNTRKVRIKYIF